MSEGIPKEIGRALCSRCSRPVVKVKVKNSAGRWVDVDMDATTPIYHVAWNEDGTGQATRATRYRVMAGHLASCKPKESR